MKIKGYLSDIAFFILGGAIYSVGIISFLTPNKISPGGVTGIAAVGNYLFSFPIGLTVFIINIPLLIAAYMKFGKAFIFKTAVATVCVSAVLDIFELFLPRLYIDSILASVFGGILTGLGISIIMLRGSTTGGVDIVAKFVNNRYPFISMGKIMLAADTAVVLIATFVYKNTQSALYSAIAIYSSSRIMDVMLYGADKGKIIYVISHNTQDIVYDILNTVKRGVTVIDVTGGYKKEKKQMIMCTVRRNQVHTVCKYVRRHDQNAFIVVAEAGEIFGQGFKK